jgi:hypothetical protein
MSRYKINTKTGILYNELPEKEIEKMPFTIAAKK